MVQFPRYRFCTLCIHAQMNAIQDVRVTPFGHPRISGCLLLPVAFRSLPRPSSPDSSKASPANSYSLDHITPSSSRSIKLGISTSGVVHTTPERRQLSLFPSLTEPRQPPEGIILSLKETGSLSGAVKDLSPWTTQVASATYHQPGRLVSHGAIAPRLLSYVLEVWGFEPQTYGLQSHRSSHLSYTPMRVSQGALLIAHRLMPGWNHTGSATKREERANQSCSVSE